MLTHFERWLNESERTALVARVAKTQQRLERAWWTSLLASAAVCGVLLVLTLIVSDASPLIVIGFWVVVATVLGVWVARSSRADDVRQLALLRGALQHRRARGVRIKSARVVEFEEIEDEGACYAFEVDRRRVCFVMGQEFYASETFPNTDFSLVQVVNAAGQVVDEFLHADGEHLVSERLVSSATKDARVIPGHLEVVTATLDDIEAQLPPRTS